MESDKSYKLKLDVLKEAVQTFEASLNIDLKKFSDTEVDAIKNGQIQKFEYCVELLWKTMQGYINEIIGEDISGPKPVIKSFFTHKIIDEKTYNLLYEIINARNSLAHIYDKNKFEEIYKKIFGYLPVIKEVLKHLQ